MTDNEVQTFLEGKENQYAKRKTESCVFGALLIAFLSAKNENRQLEDLLLPILAVYLKDFFCR